MKQSAVNVLLEHYINQMTMNNVSYVGSNEYKAFSQELEQRVKSTFPERSALEVENILYDVTNHVDCCLAKTEEDSFKKGFRSALSLCVEFQDLITKGLTAN